MLRQACSSKLGLAPAALKLFELREVPAGAELSADAAQIGVMVEGSGEKGPALTVLNGGKKSASECCKGWVCYQGCMGALRRPATQAQTVTLQQQHADIAGLAGSSSACATCWWGEWWEPKTDT